MSDLKPRYDIALSYEVITHVLYIIGASLAVSALTFVRSGYVLNPSRCDPMMVNCRASDNQLTLHNNPSSIVMFASTVITKESHIVTGKKIGNTRLKYIAGIFHAIEWERACLFMCMVFSTDKLSASAGVTCTYHAFR
jgi:hypothetical protein